MKKLILLSLTLLAASVGAMEGLHTKEKIPTQAEPKKVPSLVALCTQKLIEHAESFENPEEVLERIPSLSANAACDIIEKFPQDIIDANASMLKRYLFDKLSPAVKAAIVRRIPQQIEPSIMYDLFDAVLDSKNTHADRNVLGCTLFESCKELQTWENIIKLADQGLITVKAAEIAILFLKKTLDQPLNGAPLNPESMISFMRSIKMLESVCSPENKEILKQAFFNLTDRTMFEFDVKETTDHHYQPPEEPGQWILENEAPCSYIIPHDCITRDKNSEGNIVVYDKNQKLIATFTGEPREYAYAVISKDGLWCLLFTVSQMNDVNLAWCEIQNTQTHKTARLFMDSPTPLVVFFDTKNNLVLDFNNISQMAHTPSFYFDYTQIPLGMAALFYLYQENAFDHLRPVYNDVQKLLENIYQALDGIDLQLKQ